MLDTNHLAFSKIPSIHMNPVIEFIKYCNLFQYLKDDNNHNQPHPFSYEYPYAPRGFQEFVLEFYLISPVHFTAFLARRAAYWLLANPIMQGYYEYIARLTS